MQSLVRRLHMGAAHKYLVIESVEQVVGVYIPLLSVTKYLNRLVLSSGK